MQIEQQIQALLIAPCIFGNRKADPSSTGVLRGIMRGSTATIRGDSKVPPLDRPFSGAGIAIVVTACTWEWPRLFKGQPEPGFRDNRP